MNNKEVNEIRKILKPDAQVVHYLRFQYVSFGDKGVIADQDIQLRSMEDGDLLTFFGLLGKSLSGKIGKTLSNVEIPNTKRLDGLLPEKMLDGNDHCPAEDDLLKTMRERIVAEGNYVIMLARGAYDIPIKTKDNMKLGDSEEVYSFILAAVCPVKQVKGGVTFDGEKFVVASPTPVLDAPVSGFLYPAFTDRTSDRSGVLVFTKNMAQDGMTVAVFGKNAPAEKAQQAAFAGILQSTLGDNADYGIVSAINEKINERIDGSDKSEGELKLQKEELRQIFEDAGADVSTFDKAFDENLPEGEIVAQAVAQKTVTVESPDILVTAKDLDAAKKITQKTINGSHCLVIELRDNRVVLNGTEVLA